VVGIFDKHRFTGPIFTIFLLLPQTFLDYWCKMFHCSLDVRRLLCDEITNNPVNNPVENGVKHRLRCGTVTYGFKKFGNNLRMVATTITSIVNWMLRAI
jgi:hypothetical protein